MWQYLLQRLLAWLQGITADQWTQAVKWVIAVEQSDQTNHQKWKLVRDKLIAQFPNLTTSAMNLLIEAAVSFTKRSA
jgi:hypothetical protein